ncbi:hypothetical protein FRX31_018317 [Thalictrum thalictroides]|uniref:Uncharacterized protein n=1 Tax=Thalictrum thalictroides TaxID=46969 RepID=A0A7J6W3Z6_THATH|nr:hypothetical protein FRX31_018317 [Thalictrum thalictroides]
MKNQDTAHWSLPSTFILSSPGVGRRDCHLIEFNKLSVIQVFSWNVCFVMELPKLTYQTLPTV